MRRSNFMSFSTSRGQRDSPTTSSIIHYTKIPRCTVMCILPHGRKVQVIPGHFRTHALPHTVEKDTDDVHESAENISSFRASSEQAGVKICPAPIFFSSDISCMLPKFKPRRPMVCPRLARLKSISSLGHVCG